MTATGMKAKCRGMVGSYTPIKIYMKENLWEIKPMEKAFTDKSPAKYTKDTGSTTSPKARANKHLSMVQCTRASFVKASRTVMEYTCGLMALSTRASGKTMSSTARVIIHGMIIGGI